MSDKRKAERLPCFIRGEITTESGEARPCEVHDLSATGARLVALNAKHLPEFFMLAVPRRHIESEVRVIRRNINELGVVFLEKN